MVDCVLGENILIILVLLVIALHRVAAYRLSICFHL